MAISLSDIKRNTMGPPRIVIYGVPGIGKTTLAACAPDAIWLPVEDGLAGLDVPAFPKPETYEQVLESIGALVTGEHDYKTLVLDSLSAVEGLLHDYICRTVPTEKGNAVKNLEGYGFGKGQKTFAPCEWRNFRDGLDACRARGMQILLLAHSTVEKFDDPATDPYDRYQVAINKFSEPVIYDWADAVLFLNYKQGTVDREGSDKKRGVGSGERRIYTAERPSFRAKNRYRMPWEIPVPEGKPEVAWAAIEACITAAATPVATV